jgi:aquaporin Z
VTAKQEVPTSSPLGPLARYERSVIDRINDFNDPRQEWRRLFSELLGTFFLVLAAAGGGMMGHAFPGVISHGAAVVAPALTVTAIILFMGKVSGAHLNPAVSIAFALRRDFPWWRVPGYIVVQLGGATLAVGIAFLLRGRGGDKSALGAAQGDLFTEGYESGKS